MTSPHRLAALAAFVLATAAASPDLLPLRRGIFVGAGMSCAGASEADRVSYAGGRGSISVAQAVCTIQRVSHRGNVHTVTDTCRDIASGDMIEGGPTELMIASPTSFRMNGTTYNYCGPARGR